MITDVKKNVAYSFKVILLDTADPTKAKVNPTLAAGDFKISADGGALTNLASLPTIAPAGSDIVLIALTAGEMNGDEIMVEAKDVAGAEWNEQHISMTTVANTNADIKVDTVAILIDTTGLNGDAMRGTDSAALASALVTHDGKLDTVDGIVDDILVDTTGLNGDAMRGTDSAALASALATHDSKLDTVDTNVDTINTATAGLAGAAMRGTDNAALASALVTHDSKLDTVDAVVDAILIDTTGLNGDAMRGTDNAALATALVTHDSKLDTVDGVVDAIKVDTTSIESKVDIIDTVVDAMVVSLTEIAGLELKNSFHRDLVFDGGGNLTSGLLEIYDTKANAITHDGSTGLIFSFTLTATYTGDNLTTLLHTET